MIKSKTELSRFEFREVALYRIFCSWQESLYKQRKRKFIAEGNLIARKLKVLLKHGAEAGEGNEMFS